MRNLNCNYFVYVLKSSRIRFSDIPEKEKYQNPKQHIDSFKRGTIMYLIVAVIDGIILTAI